MSNIGVRLKRERVERGLTQVSLARVSGVTDATVSKWESNGGGSMSAIAAHKIAEHLSVNPTWLVMGQGTPHGRHVPREFSKQTRSLARQIDRLSKPERDVIQQIVSVMLP